MKLWYWVALGGVLLVGLLLGWKWYQARPDPEPVLTVSFLDLATVEKISKFRSCQGHIVVPDGESEPRQNMKHYVLLREAYWGKSVQVTAPFDGVIKGLRSAPDKGLEGELWLGNRNNDWDLSIEHLRIAESLVEGQAVNAGDLLGTVPEKGIDVVYGVGGGTGVEVYGYQSPFVVLDSAFNHLDSSLAAEFLAHGLDPAVMSYSKAFREANPCRVLTGPGVQDAQLNDYEHPEDWVIFAS